MIDAALPIPENPNLNPRPVLTWLIGFLVKPLLRLFAKKPGSRSFLTVFESYSVGDLYMALPAIKLLAQSVPVRVLCRSDCIQLLKAEGLEGIPFDNVFCTKPGRASFFKTLRDAWRLRGTIGGSALDFDGDSRTALWLKIMGARRVFSYDRPYAGLFDVLLSVSSKEVHKADWNVAVAEAYLRKNPDSHPVGVSPFSPLSLVPSNAPWILSCWTRWDTKNWSLDRWDAFLERMIEAGIPFKILHAPDGDERFQTFQKRWTGRVDFLKGSLMQVAQEIQNSAGMLGTDNFFGHMAGYYGKPVLWINGSSDPRFVIPKGPLTKYVQVEPMPCRYSCIHRCYNAEYKACLNHLDVEAVWTAFTELRSKIPDNN